jgi:glycosyltransferase involved in cell wall biosynthesis
MFPIYGHKVNKIIFKSHFHKFEFDRHLGYYDKPYEIIPSGLRIEHFSNNVDNVQRNPYRFCYTTFYDRGLEFIIKHVFSTIKQIEPRAELHVYTGMDGITDEGFLNKMRELFSEHGVADHGKQPVEVIAREKHLSSFELYVSNIINEVDCVSVRESIVAGCIPLISNFGVFNERDGIKYDVNHEDVKSLKKVALQILNLLKNKEQLEEYRNKFKLSPTIYSWEQIGDMWLRKVI